MKLMIMRRRRRVNALKAADLVVNEIIAAVFEAAFVTIEKLYIKP